MEASRRLELVVNNDGEVVSREEKCPHCVAKDQAIERLTRSYEGTIQDLRNQLSDDRKAEPESEDIMEVLLFWKQHLMPRAKIVVASERWAKVRARLREKDAETGERCYTPLHLKAAAIGARLSDYHVQNRYLDAVTIYRDSKTVDEHIARVTRFKQVQGESAVTLVEHLSSEQLAWLVERCACGHLWLDHLRGGATSDGRQPCSSCGCENFDYFTAKLERWKREQDAKAIDGPPGRRQGGG